jgi:hypothetical protein
MNGTVAITDHGWYEFLLAQNGLDEENFWTPSAGILVMLRTRTASPSGMRMALAVGASPEPAAVGTSGSSPDPVTRGVYDLDAAQLRPLPFAAEEAQFVSGVFRGPESQLLVKEAATEAALRFGVV